MGACGSTVRSRQTEKPLRLPKSKDFKCEKTKKTLYRDLPPPGDSDQHDVPLIGVAKITVAGAKLQAKGNYNVTLSMGLQVQRLWQCFTNCAHVQTQATHKCDQCRASCQSPSQELQSQNLKLSAIL